MLATNANLYRRVLQLDIAKEAATAKVDWTRFFDRSSSYRLLYTIQIVQAVLEEGEGSPRRVSIINAAEFPGGKRDRHNSLFNDNNGHEEVHPESEEGLTPLLIRKSSSQIVESP